MFGIIKKSFGNYDKNLAMMLLLPSILIVLLLDLYPIIYSVIISFQKRSLFDMSGIFIGFKNYFLIFKNPNFPSLLKNTLIWTFSTTFFEVSFGMVIALLLNRNFKLRNLARALILVPYVVPVIVSTLVWKYMFNDLIGLINYLLQFLNITKVPIAFFSNPTYAMVVVILINVWTFTPFAIINVLSALQNINGELYEAAKLDGANTWREFKSITFPSILPILTIVILLRTVWNFQKFEIIWLTTKGGPLISTTTLPVYVYSQAFFSYNLGSASAVAVIMFIILFLLAMLYIRLFENTESRLK